MSEPSLEQIAAEAADTTIAGADAILAREIIALREYTEQQVGVLHDRFETDRPSTTARLDSHNHVMESIVSRVRALEGAHVIPTVVGVDGPDLLLSDGTTRPSFKAFERIAELEQRAETAERERDEAVISRNGWKEAHEKASRERDLARGGIKQWSADCEDLIAARSAIERLRKYARHHDTCMYGARATITSARIIAKRPCTCGLTAVLEDA